MNNSFSTLFYPKGNDVDKNGLAPLYMRITVDGKRSELSVKRKINPEKWNSQAGKMKGTTQEIRELNRFMDHTRAKVNMIYDRLMEEGLEVTPLLIKNAFLGKSKTSIMTLDIFKDHNDKIAQLVGKEYAPGTIERYCTAKKHVEEYINKEYKVKDIPIKKVDHAFIDGFEYYLKTERDCAHNTAVKYITNFKKIVRIAFANDWIQKDPFLHWKGRLKIVDREYLTESEIQQMLEKEISNARLDQVKDIFLFSCFTGLAYADVKKLSNDNVVLGIDGEKWIKIKRSKTDTRSNIPILPSAQAIIDKYAEHPGVLNGDRLLPVLSNQKMNAYLKEIADLCGIKKNLTYHLARHTFATTITLTNGVSIESVSKMLGHKSLKTTQHYAKILDRKVSDDMKMLRKRLNFNN